MNLNIIYNLFSLCHIAISHHWISSEIFKHPESSDNFRQSRTSLDIPRHTPLSCYRFFHLSATSFFLQYLFLFYIFYIFHIFYLPWTIKKWLYLPYQHFTYPQQFMIYLLSLFAWYIHYLLYYKLTWHLRYLLL